jgi:hypothetical protein
VHVPEIIQTAGVSWRRNFRTFAARFHPVTLASRKHPLSTRTQLNFPVSRADGFKPEPEWLLVVLA